MGKVKEDTPATGVTNLPSTALVGPSSSAPRHYPSRAPPQTSLLPPLLHPHPPHLLHSHVIPLPSTTTLVLYQLSLSLSFEPDDTPGSSSDSSEAFNVMERPATPPDPTQPPPLPEARRNFPAAGTLVVVQGVVHTSDVSQPGISEPSGATSRRASSVPPPGERSSRRRFSDLLARPMRSRRSSYAAPESQPSEISATLENDSQDESSPTSESSQE